MDTLLTALCILGAYFVGGIPSAYVIGRVTRGIDVRIVGTRNVGTANVWRQVGRWQGVVVLLADAGKGAGTVGVVRALDLPDWGLFAACVAAVAGHNFSPYLRLYGGKGVAVVVGVSLALMPLLTAAVGLPVAAAVLVLARNIVWAFALGAIAFWAALVVTGETGANIALITVMALTVGATAYGRARREWHETIGSFIRRVAKKPS